MRFAEEGTTPGAARPTVVAPTVRCAMTTLAQPGLAFAPWILEQLNACHDGCFGVYATVVQEGTVAVGDRVALL